MENTTSEKQQRIKSWIKKVGLIGFLFFLLKGIAWLVVGYLVLK